jgi:serine/threonine protein kinase
MAENLGIESGSQIGEYDITDFIARGGMASVFRGRHRRLKREVAIKVLPPEYAEAEMLDQFQREVEVGGLLNHSNIARAFDAGSFGEKQYLVTEFIDGCSLEKIIQSQGPMTIREMGRCVLQTAAGLSYAHEQGVIHRDIKPSNIMLSDNGKIKIIDFGLARYSCGLHCFDETFLDEIRPAKKILSVCGEPNALKCMESRILVCSHERKPDQQSTRRRVCKSDKDKEDNLISDIDSSPKTSALSETGSSLPLNSTFHTSVVGTTAFMPPEQTQTSKVDRRADIYSLGCVMYYLLTGNLVFPEKTYEDFVLAHCYQPPPNIFDSQGNVPIALDNIFHRMVAKRVLDRYQHVDEVIADLNAVLVPLNSEPLIFISYRRNDSIDASYRLYEILVEHFGQSAVSMDLDSIPSGVDFRRHIQTSIGRADVVLSVIGDHWLNTASKDYKSRLHDPADYVRMEIETAMRLDKPIIPVLVGGAKMPLPESLPDTLCAFCFKNAAELRAGREYSSLSLSLAKRIEEIINSTQ